VSPAGVTVGLQASALVSGLIKAFRSIAIENAATSRADAVSPADTLKLGG
jgi:hypothetical protein